MATSKKQQSAARDLAELVEDVATAARVRATWTQGEGDAGSVIEATSDGESDSADDACDIVDPNETPLLLVEVSEASDLHALAADLYDDVREVVGLDPREQTAEEYAADVEIRMVDVADRLALLVRALNAMQKREPLSIHCAPEGEGDEAAPGFALVG